MKKSDTSNDGDVATGHTDLYIRRAYTYGNITIVVDIDLMKREVSLVDHEGKLRKYAFANRSIEYMNGWLNILSAMKYATVQAKMVLEAEAVRDEKQFAELMIAISNPKLRKGEQ